MERNAKPLTRIFTDADLGQGRSCTMDGGPAHKLRTVLRAQPGDEVLLFNGRDGEWRAQLSHVAKNRADAKCLAQTRVQREEPGPWLAFAPVKKEQTDMIVEKAVELGVERILPVITQRTESRRVKSERLQQQIIDASEQCERLTLPVLEEPQSLDALLKIWPADRALLVCAERQDVQPLPKALDHLSRPVGILTGPEGGFLTMELDAALKLPISMPVSLGPRILRAETAAIAALAVIQALTGDWSHQ